MLGGDLVAVWEVALSDGVHRVEFAHGTTTGKRVVYINGEEVLRKDWMFKLVGKETFTVGGANTRATVSIEAISGFAYQYSLDVDGKSLQKFTDNRAKTTKTWVLRVDGEDRRVVLEKDTMDVWCNGQKMDTTMLTDSCFCLLTRFFQNKSGPSRRSCVLSSSGRVRGRRHRDLLHAGRARVLHQGDQQREEEPRHRALLGAGRRENPVLHTVEPDRSGPD
ncbi:fas apoptotic inhibitory molecule 1-like isoform X1 [Brachyistius frenatus]|uniref:fas apoptotic inhibitory molecule 1-like isoform X1 n=1 Tax=Brachyistius frenatus TaxID=100188 RepID=UPI0037E72E37